MTEEETDILSLYGVPGVGSKTFLRLVSYFGSAGTVFGASKKELMGVDGVGTVIAGSIVTHDRREYIRRQKILMDRVGATMLTRSSESYPPLLDAFVSAPPVLFVRGDSEVLKQASLAFVGTRKPSPYGLRMTRKLVTGAVDAGICVVSGMAEGVDSEAHTTALERGGKTVAVFGCGVDVIYPVFNRTLSENIIESGCLISHFPMGTKCSAGNFPARNAVIVGLSQGSVIVEAPKKSGAMITADLTLKAGRKLFTVPGNVDSPTSEGTNSLITRGAHAVSNIENILTVLEKPFPPGVTRTAEKPLPPGIKGEILKTLTNGPLQMEVICSILGKSASEILSEMTMLEIEGHVMQRPGKIFERV